MHSPRIVRGLISDITSNVGVDTKMSHITILLFISVHNFQHEYQSFQIARQFVRPFICLYALEFYSPVSIDVISD